MGIDNVAIKTFNSSGSQSVCRANEADETKLIESQFLTKCTTKYINGSGISFIPGRLSMLPIAGATANETFTLPSDVDAISELIFHCEINLALANGEAVSVSSSLVLDMINKIEMKIGNLVFQTIRPCDIYARNITEHGAPLKLLMSQSSATVGNGTASNPILTITEGAGTSSAMTLDFSMSIPFTGRDSNTERSFLQAGASTNSLSMKVYYNQFSSVSGHGGSSTRAGFLLPASANNVTGVSTGICVLSHQITQTEKNFIQKNIINRVVNTSQSVEHYFSVNDLTTGSSTLTIDLGSININVSHIILSLATTLYGKTQADVLISSSDNAQGTSWTPREPFRPARMRNVDLGVQSGWLKSAEMVLGNDRTGNVPASCLTTNRIQQFNLKSADNKNLFIIKLADSAFSTAGIPFARLNNKKLVLKFADGFINASNAAKPLATCVHVTCCGTQIQTTVGGAISFSA